MCGSAVLRFLWLASSLFLALSSQVIAAIWPNQYGATCYDCHGMPPIDSAYRNISTGGFKGNHSTHNPSGTVSQAVCEKCHSGSSGYTAGHLNGFINMTSNINNSPHPSHATYNKPRLFPQSGNPVMQTCTNVNCHFEAESPLWGSPAFTSADQCSSCHPAPGSSSSHARHETFYPFSANGCTNCHPDYKSGLRFSHATSAGQRGIIVRLASGNYTGSGRNFLPSESGRVFGQCTNVYCHSDGKGHFAAPTWAVPGSGACGTCHSNPMSTNGHAAHLTAAYGPNFGTDATGLSNCSICHIFTGESGATHLNGSVDTQLTTCGICHPAGTPSWTAGRVSCESCHTGETLSIINGIMAPGKPLAATTGHGKPFSSIGTAMNVSCQACHDQNSVHISSDPLVHFTRLTTSPAGNINNECNFCHRDEAEVPTARFRNVSTHFTSKNGQQNMECRQCHDPHGTSNVSMIKTTIAYTNTTSWSIAFTNTSSGMIDPVTNRGLCQVCHTQTNHYRAGVPETAHESRNCFNCHTHGAAGGAFSTSGGACDRCHGYPPVPKSAVVGPTSTGGYKQTFGTFNNYTDAKYENYSGGGGAHLYHVATCARVSDSWSNCSICHTNGTKHRVSLPVDGDWRSASDGIISNVTVTIDQRFIFISGLLANYTGAHLVNRPYANNTGSCSNIFCHGMTPRWSVDR